MDIVALRLGPDASVRASWKIEGYRFIAVSKQVVSLHKSSLLTFEPISPFTGDATDNGDALPSPLSLATMS
jgi:hypothetical protein